MNKIGLDISKISTAMVIETSNNEYILSYSTIKPTEKWNKSMSNIIKSRYYKYENESETKSEYSESEINKLNKFIQISNDLISDILNTINKDEETIINIEGFSYSSSAGAIIDLVGIASIIRAKLIENVPNIKSIKIIAPKSLKLAVCSLVYGNTVKINKKGKESKEINTNEDGKSGGNFDKIDMFKSIIKMNNSSKLIDYCLINKDEILKLKKIPKPLEDIIDAYLLKCV